MKNDFHSYQSQINQIAQEFDICYLGIFGSQARGNNHPSSDIDMIVEFNKPGGLLRRAKVKLKLEKLFNKQIDLVSKNSINRDLKPYILNEVIDIYDKET